jgi:secondary thiamine-phosphate synthase enzyme
MHQLSLQTAQRTQLVNITSQVRDAVRTSDARAVVVFVPHTTAGVVVQADGGLAVARDVGAALERIVDEGWDWEHTEEEGEQNPWSHVRAALTSTSVTIPIEDGELALGRFQAIFFCEFDGPRSRTVYITTY